MSIKFDKIMGDIREKDGDDCLKLDQTTPQTVENGMPLFEGGIKVPMNGVSTFYGCNSPVVYNGADCYVSPDPEDPEDTGLGAVWYIEGEVIIYDDDGTVTPTELVGMTGATTTTINLHITGVNFGSEEEPYWIYLTGYSDVSLAAFTTYEDTLFGLEGALVGVYTEVAFTYNAGTDTYTKVATLAVCAPSTNTTWTDPMVVGKVAGGFIVDPITANILHTANYVHNGNYTCNNTTKVLRHKGQVKVGNGHYADYITAPLVANPVFNVAGTGGLQFAMTFVPEVVRTGGTVGSPASASIYVAGMYGTTVIEGSYTNFSGTAIGGWAAIQNAAQGLGVTLSEGVAMRAGMTYASEYNLVVTALSCFQTSFTNLNNGTSSHTTLKHFETGDMGDKATATTAYGLYIRDNSTHATNSWGLYSLEPSNYARKLYLGATPTKPTEDLEVQANAKAAGIITAIVSPIADGTTGLQICKADKTTPVINVDTTNKRLGVGTVAPVVKLDVVADAETSTAEKIARFRVSDAPNSYISIENNSANNTKFMPSIRGYNGDDERTALRFVGDVADDTWYTTGQYYPAITFQAKNRVNSNPLAVAPVASWINGNNVVMQIWFDAKTKIGGTDVQNSAGGALHAPTTMLDVVGSGSTDLLNLIDGTTSRVYVKESGNVGIGTTDPSEKLDVNGSVKAAGYKTGTETGQTTTVTVVTDTRMNSGQLEKKTQVLTYTAGLLTAKGAESEWTATTDI